MKTLFNLSFGILMAAMITESTFSQLLNPGTVENIAVTGRPSKDSICLRWAPLNYHVWQLGNTYGYRIERFVISRNGTLLQKPEKSTRIQSIKPLPENQWEHIVRNNKYGTITAQALFGDRFEVDLSQSDLLTIVNKVRENEQRFAFALFSADMSPQVARASGLWFTDQEINIGEKYLYRIIISSADSIRGSIFISPDDDYLLPRPQNLKADFKGRFVSLRWDKYNTIHYTAHIIERSGDGINFSPISETPIVTVSPTETEDTHHDYAIDSLNDLSKTFYYRVKGITAFGEESPGSDIVSGMRLPIVTQVPYITSVDNVENTSLQVHWSFPQENNNAIKHFIVERSAEPKGKFSSVTGGKISPETRVYEDQAPEQVNYYRLTAEGLNGELYSSHIYFAQLIDSIPPALPIEISASITKEGVVTLSWKPNHEPDIYGYRIYKSTYLSEERAQLTADPIQESLFTDHVDLNTLNESVYYSVMAIDQNQNHSKLSDPLKVTLPDVVRPQAPVLLPVRNTSQGVLLHWIPSSSYDVTKYAVYRKTTNDQPWERISVTSAGQDSIFSYVDASHGAASNPHHYTVIAIDEAGLESDPAHPVTGRKIDSKLKPSIHWGKHKIIREKDEVTLRWINDQNDIAAFRIYKSVNDGPPILYRSISGEKEEIIDTLVPGQLYTYRIMAIFNDGNKSLMSDEMSFQY